MALYLNPKDTNFREMVTRRVYVDKTMMIATLNETMQTSNKYVCISRPRRFGKTTTGNMISAYFSKGCDSHELFAPFKIASDPSFESNLNKFNVIKIDVNGEYQSALNKEKTLQLLTKRIRLEFQKQFADIQFDEDDSIASCIQKVYEDKDEQFVIIMDEYDSLVREKVSQELFSEYLAFLNGLFKNDTLRPAIALAYITGILPLVRDKVQSKLNTFWEYTILDAGDFAEFIGFTESEVRDLCEKHGMDFSECRQWYDGYHQHGFDIYNPESVVCAVQNKAISNYWSKTSTYAVISDLIKMNFDGTKGDVIRMLAGENIDVNVTRFLNTMTDFASKHDVFTYLIHVGYLAYDFETKTCCIPNNEIREEWFSAISVNADYSVTNKIIESSKEVFNQMLVGNAQAVAKALDESHIHVTSNRSYNNEDALQSAIYLAFIYALNKYTVIREMTAGKGFADVVYIPVHPKPETPAIIIELKRNGSSETALNQIREKKYFESLEHYSGDLLFVGINYDEETKTHDCSIEKFVK